MIMMPITIPALRTLKPGRPGMKDCRMALRTAARRRGAGRGSGASSGCVPLASGCEFLRALNEIVQVAPELLQSEPGSEELPDCIRKQRLVNSQRLISSSAARYSPTASTIASGPSGAVHPSTALRAALSRESKFVLWHESAVSRMAGLDW
jgi:hypothetical protein